MMPPQLVQEPLSTTDRNASEQFVFLVCQQGAEPTIKARLLGERSPLRLAFSRPGLLTFKSTEPDTAPPQDWLIRQSGHALGPVRGAQAEDLVDQTLQLAGSAWDAVHVFQRDSGLPGLRGFEPGPTELTLAIGELFRQRLSADGGQPSIQGAAAIGSRILDVVLVEPDNWLIGHHQAEQRPQCWPGGVYPITPPPQMVSRAYLKMSEAVAWSGLPVESGDEIVEIGSAPGGSCQRLLDLGLNVTGVDPGQMDDLLLQHPRFTHWRSKSAGIRRKQFAKFRWLAADANVAPNYTLDFVEDIVQYPTSRLEGLLLTFKLSTYALADQLPSYLQRIREWGFERCEVRQLAFNRQECCVVAQRAAGWRSPSRAEAMQRKARANAQQRRNRAAKARQAEPAVEPEQPS